MSTNDDRGPSEAVLDAAERFVVVLIDGAASVEEDSVIADTAGLGMAISDWKRPEPSMGHFMFARWCRGIEEHFRELFPRRKPRPLTADRCARVILDGFDAELLHIEDYRIEAIEMLLAMSLECGPTNRLDLLRFVEAYVENAPDEAFEAEPIVDPEAPLLERMEERRRYARGQQAIDATVALMVSREHEDGLAERLDERLAALTRT